MALCDQRMTVIVMVTFMAGSLTEEKGMVGIDIGDIVETSSRTRFDNFISSLRRGGATTGVELVIDLNDGPAAMVFCGAELEDSVFLVAGKTADDIITMMEDDGINDEREWAAHLHSLKRKLLEAHWPIPQDENVLDEMTRLNNEIVNTSRDLAKRNKELTLEREKERITISSIREAVVVTDHHLRITLMNDTAQELTGWHIDEAEGRSVREVVNFLLKEEDQTVEYIFWNSFQNGKITPLPPDCFLLGKDGVARPVEQSVSPIVDQFGGWLGLVIIFRDMTERQRMEQNLRDLNDLVRLVNKTMRHDIQNGLNATRSALELYRIKGEERTLLMAEKSLARCQKLIEELKGLERTTNSEGLLKQYDVRLVAEQIMRNFDLPYRIEGDTCQVLADEALPSVLENLVRNALVHGKADRIQLSIAKDKGNCQVSVADWGSGIPDELKPRIFEEGFSHGESRGTGIGLYIVQKVMKRYGGSVSVRDNTPSGSVFDLRFRIAK